MLLARGLAAWMRAATPTPPAEALPSSPASARYVPSPSEGGSPELPLREAVRLAARMALAVLRHIPGSARVPEVKGSPTEPSELEAPAVPSTLGLAVARPKASGLHSLSPSVALVPAPLFLEVSR